MNLNETDSSKIINYEEDFIENIKNSDLTTSLKTKLLSMRDQEISAGNLRKELQIKIFNLEASYEKLLAELYIKREKIQKGEEISNLAEKIKFLDLEKPENKGENLNINIEESGVPEFWLRALENIEFKLPSKINDKDSMILKYLKNITVETTDKGSFTLNFIFEQNQYFSNTLLYKKFVLDENDFSISQIISSEIKWTSKENNPFYILELGEEENEDKKNRPCKLEKRNIIKPKKGTFTSVDSFFSFFENLDINSNSKNKSSNLEECGENIEEDEEDFEDYLDDEKFELRENMKISYEFGLFLRNKFILNAVKYYLDDLDEEEIRQREEIFNQSVES